MSYLKLSQDVEEYLIQRLGDKLTRAEIQEMATRIMGMSIEHMNHIFDKVVNRR